MLVFRRPAAWRRYAAPTGKPWRLLARADSTSPVYTGSWSATVLSGPLADAPAPPVSAVSELVATRRSCRYRSRAAGGSRPPTPSSPVATVALASDSAVYRLTA